MPAGTQGSWVSLRTAVVLTGVPAFVQFPNPSSHRAVQRGPGAVGWITGEGPQTQRTQILYNGQQANLPFALEVVSVFIIQDSKQACPLL